MKIWYLECTEEELKANRGIMDSVVDAINSMCQGIFGDCTPVYEEEAESEEQP